MSEFKVGDKVVRVGGNYMNVKRGEHYTVYKIEVDGSLMLSEIDGWYDDAFFQLAKEEEMPQQFKNMKFDVAAIAKELGKPHEEASRIIQEALFELGYDWTSNKRSVLYTDRDYLIAGGGVIMCSYKKPRDWIWYEQHTIKQTFSIVPVEQEEFVELNGKKYNKKELEAALSMLKPVEEL